MPGKHGPRFQGIGSIFKTDLSAKQPRDGAKSSSNGAITLSARSGDDSGRRSVREDAGGRGARERVFHGSQSAAREERQQAASTFEPGEFNLNFQNADIREVIQSVLGEALNENYTIDPGIGGTVTMSSARPLSRDDLLPALEVALQTVGAALVRDDGVNRITIEASAVANRTDYLEAQPGYGITIIPLEHISANTLISLIEGFGARPGSVRAESRRNLLVVMGNSVHRRAAIKTALNFDADWMENQSVAILPLENAKPETVIPELERVFGARSGESGPVLVQFMAMQRLRAVLAVSPRRQVIERARTWVQRLDTKNPDLDSDVFVYRVKYRDAKEMAGLLNSIFSASGAFAPDAAGDQVEPRSEAVSLEALRPEGAGNGPGGGPGAPGGPTGQQQQGRGLLQGGPDLIAGRDSTTGPDAFEAGDASDRRRKGARIQADTANNSLVIYADRETRKEILAALNRIDVPQLQVAINVTMAEIRLNDELRYGIQYFVKSKTVGAGDDNGSFGLFNTIVDNISRELPGFNFVLGSENSPEAIISAFKGITDVEILSSPSLVVVENETARFQVGDQIPIVTRTVTSVQDPEAPVSNEVEYRDTGIILKIKPRIAENGVVNLNIAQEISSVTSGAGSLTPTISNRGVESTISVVDGQTVLLGGLIGEQTTRDKTGVPGLSRIPGIGALFRSKFRQGTRTELIILLRPSVIRGSEDAQHVAEELRARMWRARQTQ